jgi:hypothetical protein
MIALPRRERASPTATNVGAQPSMLVGISGLKLYPFWPSDATNSGAEAIRGKTHFSAGGQWEWPHRFRCTGATETPPCTNASPEGLRAAPSRPSPPPISVSNAMFAVFASVFRAGCPTLTSALDGARRK